MQDWLTARAAATPNTLALLHNDMRLTYAQLDDRSNAMAISLRAKGVEARQHVAVLMEAGPAYISIIFGLMRLNAILIPLNTRLTVPELRWQVKHADVNWLLFDDANTERAVALNASRTIAIIGQAPATTDQISSTIDRDQLQTIIFTSGTTRSPKGVALTYGNHYASANASAYRIGLQPDDLWLSCLPLYHVGGLAVFLRSCLYGTGVLLHNRFDVAQVSEVLDQLPVTMISLVPTMLYRLLEHRSNWDLPHLRCVLLGGAAAHSDLLARAFAAGIPIHTTYGLTEAASQVATMLPDGVRQKPGSVGRGLLFTQTRIVDQAGGDLPVGEIGEVWVSGPTVMRGYYNNPNATAEVLHAGWLRTGDIGYLDAAGDLFILQRRSDLIISGGENVLPSEVEAVLKAHPAVADVVVVGVADPEWGQKVAAVVIPSAAVTAADLQSYARDHLAGPKLPRLFRFVDAFPQTASGKVQRAKVRALFND